MDGRAILYHFVSVLHQWDAMPTSNLFKMSHFSYFVPICPV